MYSCQHSRNVPIALQNRCDFGRLAEMFPLVTREMLFPQHDTNAPLVLREKRYLGHMTEMYPPC